MCTKLVRDIERLVIADLKQNGLTIDYIDGHIYDFLNGVLEASTLVEPVQPVQENSPEDWATIELQDAERLAELSRNSPEDWAAIELHELQQQG